ncbi:hypothetical protein [Halocynthiibacter namhaensis]|uniref:hypothetical protein n=1 Tax=Halocynthiibacter namhaensis TaxID=1290553 RepID=UPI00138DE8FA|nr:hypothetical protein [Halocynthiibacter namhaensis]
MNAALGVLPTINSPTPVLAWHVLMSYIGTERPILHWGNVDMGGNGVKNLGFWLLMALIIYATFKGAA